MSTRSVIRTFQAIALIAGVALALGQARAAGHLAQTTVQVRATVEPSVVLRLEHAAAQVTVSQADIARGYVDLPESSLLSVNAGFLKPVLVVDFSPNGSAFSSVEVKTAELPGVERELKALSSVDDVTRMAAAQENGSTTLISYRFRLTEGVRPGRYPVPMTLNVGL